MSLSRLTLGILASGLLALAGCPQSGPASQPTPSPASNPGTPDDWKVAFIHPGATTDRGWNALGLEGATLVSKELACPLEQVEEKDPKKYEDSLSDFARRGAKVVFAHGYEYQDPCLEIGKKFPGTVFVVSSGDKSAANQVGLVLRLDEGCYLAGILAAHLTKTKKLGAVGGVAFQPVKSGFEAFARGVKSVDPKIEVVPPAYLSSWDDIAKGREQALALLAAGCDVVIHNADTAGLGVFDAVKSRGALAIGTNRNQNAEEGGSVVAGSAVLDLPRAMLDVARAVKAGKLEPKPFVLDMKTGYCDFVLNDALKDRIPEAARTKIAEARKAILAGTLDVGKD